MTTATTGGRYLFSSAERNEFEQLRSLVKEFDLTAQDEEGYTNLHWAAVDDQPRVIEVFIYFGADPEARDHMGRTALTLAVHVNAIEAVAALIKCKADVSTADDRGFTPLHSAVFSSEDTVFSMLLDAGAENCPTLRGFTPLHFAKVKGLTDRVIRLITSPRVSRRERLGYEA
ncbi:MAG: hypothetical protein KR126chlam1_01285 [Chlamydiae bacterium]|nr:hypothetical protein [Chlamydiota bacterium]